MAAPLESFDPYREEEPVSFHSQAAAQEEDFFGQGLKHLLHDSIDPHQAGAAEPWGLLLAGGHGGSLGPAQAQAQAQPHTDDVSPRTVQETSLDVSLSGSGSGASLSLSGGSGASGASGSSGRSSRSAAAVAGAEAKLAEAEGKLAALAQQLRETEAQGRALAAAAGAEVTQARAKASALEEELRTARELIEDNGGLYDEAFVSRVLTEHAQLKAQMTDSTDVLLAAAQADDEEAAPGSGGCLKGVLRLKGVGFVEFGEVERALRKDHVSKETVEALFDAMGGLITDASFEVFQRRMGEIVGEDRAAVMERLAAVPLTGKKRPRPEAFDALASLFLRKRREMEEANPSGVYASYKLWCPHAGREQTLAEAVRAVVAAHGQLRAQLAAAKAENALLRRQVYGSTGGGGGALQQQQGGGGNGGRGRSRSPGPAGAASGRGARASSPVPVAGAGAGAGAATRGRSRSPVPKAGPAAGRR